MQQAASAAEYVEQLARMIVKQDINAKSVNIKARNITIASEAGNLVAAGGAQVEASEDLNLAVENIIATASAAIATETTSAHNSYGNLTTEVGLSSLGSTAQMLSGKRTQS